MSSFANPEPVQIETGSVGKLVEQVRTLATWVFRTDSPISYVRSYSSMMNIAVAVSGRKTVRIGNHIKVNDPKNYLLMHEARIIRQALKPARTPLTSH